MGDGRGTAGRAAARLVYADRRQVLLRPCEEHDAYRELPGAAECVNAIGRNRGLQQFVVQGIPRCLGVLTIFALAHNVMRAVALLG